MAPLPDRAEQATTHDRASGKRPHREPITRRRYNTYVYAGTDWAVVDLGTGAQGFVSKSSSLDTIIAFQAAYSGSGNDTVKGTNGNDTLGGGAGNDLIVGRDGFDMADYGTAYGAAPTIGAVVNLSSASVTLGGTAYAGNTARDGWGNTDTLSEIEGAIGTAFGDTLIGRTGGGSPSRLEGGAGNDSLAGGNLSNVDSLAGANTILGGAGDDLILSNGYNESLYGGDGLDTLIYTRSVSATIDLGTDNTGPDGYQGSFSSFSNQTAAYGFERAYAGRGNDTLKGTLGDDTLSGDAGSDVIDGRGGVDTVDYGSSFIAAPTTGVFVNLSTSAQTFNSVTVAAGTARDGWGGTDTLTNIEGILGTVSADTLIGSNLDNLLTGGAGADFLSGSGGNDTLLAGAGDDTLRGGDGADSIDGSAGNDIVYGGIGSDVIDGGEVAARNAIDYRLSPSGYAAGALTVLFTGPTTATVTKTDGIDTLRNINQFYGGDAADRFDLSAVSATAPWTYLVRAAGGSDTVIGNGTDRVVVDYNIVSGAINVNLATGVVSDGQGNTDTLVNVRAILSTNGGNDILVGSSSNDTFIGSGGGSKSMTGGGGDDTYRYQGGTGVVIDLGTSTVGGGADGRVYHGGATDTLLGFDRAYGGQGNDSIKGTNGNDTLGGDYGADVIDARQGTDIVDYSAFGTTPITAGVFVNLSTATQTTDAYPSGNGGLTSVTLAAASARDSWGFIDTFGNASLPGVSNLEGAIGTDFADTLIGTNAADLFVASGGDDTISSGAAGDTIRGGAGDDSMRGGDGNDQLDGGAGWDIAVYNVASKDATWSRNAATGAWTVTINPAVSGEGTDTLTNMEALRFSDRRVEFAKAFADDVSGDGVSDILWRNPDGGLTYWAMHGLGGTDVRLPSVSTDWILLGTGDLNGDGQADLLWRHSDGALATWFSGGTGFAGGGTIADVSTAWKIAAIGDMNRDGRADILWRHTDGTVALWEMDGTSVIGGGSIAAVDTSWSLVGLADLNGDGRSDIVWRHTDGTVSAWLMDGTRSIGGGTIYNPGSSWTVTGLGDFDGDGNADLLWRNTDGAVVAWTMEGTAVKATGPLGHLDLSWSVAKVADYNGDAKADILWHNNDGSVALWLMNGFEALSAGTIANAGNWTVV
ncbi:hypothetical protein E2C06_33275 [Dankookia rubra]|uniref:Calcium-binding protein n=1 Tax=Dankookia rubra TaxID=1442381 RepID=A0A4R5Q607_9PROT|nr:FG-GAP-like repeat-containing protein [Dankookia rubra]TDH58304.1 hypothetical protein E2C06_33275 [Dankookia rubra]